MEEAAGGWSRGCTNPKLYPADCQGPNSISWRTHTSTGFQLKRTSRFSNRGKLPQPHQLPSIDVCSLNEHAKIADDRTGVKTDLLNCMLITQNHLVFINCAITSNTAEKVVCTQRQSAESIWHKVANHLYMSVHKLRQECCSCIA